MISSALNAHDYVDIARIHKSGLPGRGFLSECGEDFIAYFYESISRFASSILLVWRDADSARVHGFLFCTMNKDAYYPRFFREHWREIGRHPSVYLPLARALFRRLVRREVLDYKTDLVQIAVDPTHQREGIGKTLMRSLFSTLAEKNVTQVYLQVHESNSAAITFYEALAFEIDRRFGRPRNRQLLMRKRIPAPLQDVPSATRTQPTPSGIALRVLTQADRGLWDQFVQQWDDANFFHSPLMPDIFTPEADCDVYPIGAFSKDTIVALGVGVRVKVKVPLPKVVQGRLILYASPLFRESPVGRSGVKAILNELPQIAGNRVLFTEIRNSAAFPPRDMVGVVEGWEYLPYQNFLIDLSAGSDAIWNSFGSHLRNQIRKAMKSGITVRKASVEDAMTAFGLIQRLYKAKGIPMPSPVMFQRAIDMLLGRGVLIALVAEYEGEIIATRWDLGYKSVLYDWYAASLPEYNRLRPNELLAWTMMHNGAELGYRTYDFGGAGIRGKAYGPREFKAKFNGRLVENGRWRRSSHPLLYGAAHFCYEGVKALTQNGWNRGGPHR